MGKNRTEQGSQTKEWQQKASELKDSAKEWGGKATHMARDAGAAADLYLHEYAWTTVALVGIGGFALGYLVGKGKSS